MIGFAGKVALVTGAASGIGAATAARLAAAGAEIWLADRNPQSSEGLGYGIGAELDVTSQESWQALMARIARLDILVNAAGISRTTKAAGITEVALDAWRDVFAVNVEGTLLGCQNAIRHMAEAGGSIVNISSTAAVAPSPVLGAYGASKAAVLQMTRSFAADCALRGLPIRCNAVLPGMTETPMVAAMPTNYRAAWEEQIPAGRFASPEEIAATICFLASDEASYINGVGLPVDGGLLNRPVVR